MSTYSFETYYGKKYVKNPNIILSGNNLRDVLAIFIDSQFKKGHQPYGMKITINIWRKFINKSLTTDLTNTASKELVRDIKFKLHVKQFRLKCVSVKVRKVS